MKMRSLSLLLLPFIIGCNQSPTAVSEQEIHVSPMQQKTVSSPSLPKQLKQTSTQQKSSIMLPVPLIKQNPELKYGCEVTSVTMMLNYAGISVTKMELFEHVRKDTDPLVRHNRNIQNWGDPTDGFVGDMTGKSAGYAVFDKPIEELVNNYLPGKAVNLTGTDFSKVLEHVGKGYPAVVWTTGDYKMPDRWESWKHGQETIKTPLDLHAVVLVGYDPGFVYINDPLSGKKQVKVNKKQFIATWQAMQSRAVSYW